MSAAVVTRPGASPYTPGFKPRRCRHLTERDLLKKVIAMIEALTPLAAESTDAGRALALYQQWRNTLVLDRGAGYTFVDTHYQELRSLTDALVAANRARREPPKPRPEIPDYPAGVKVYEGEELRDMVVDLFPGAYYRINGKEVPCKAAQGSLL